MEIIMIMTAINKMTKQLTFADGVITAGVLYAIWYFADIITKYFNTGMMVMGF